MKKVINDTLVPPGGKWTYICPEDGFKIEHPYFKQILLKAKAYRRTNNYPIGLEINDQIEDNICQSAAAGVCVDFEPPSAAQKATTLVQALYKAAKSGFKVVPAEEYERRLNICKECNFFGGLTGLLKVLCRSCGCSHFKAHLGASECPMKKWGQQL